MKNYELLKIKYLYKVRYFEDAIRKSKVYIKKKENDLQKLKEEYEKEIGSK